MINRRISIFLHIYYEDTLVRIYKKIGHLLEMNNASLYVNVDYENPKCLKICKLIQWKFPTALVIKSPNKGKDIGGKLLLFNLYQRLNSRSDLLLFLHDKKSPQLIDGSEWGNSLYKIAEKNNLNKVIELLTDDNVGMVGANGNKISTSNETEEEIFMGNKELIQKLAKKYELTSTDYSFISGTMFWVKATIFESFFNKYSAIEIRNSMETGNVMDNFGATTTHSWERLFGWMVSTLNYKIKEL